MSLRYLAPAGNSFFHEKPDLVPLPISSPPDGFEFDRSIDLNQVVSRINDKKFCVVTAAPGSGKSTVLPLFAAKSSQSVLVLMPGHLLAYSTMVIARRNRDPKSAQVYYAHDVVSELRSGVTYMSYACFLASVDSGLKLNQTVVFADEAHEGDCYTYVGRTLGPALGAKCFVQLTATPTAQFQVSKSGSPGRVIDTGAWFSAKPSEWSEADEGMPWVEGQSFAFFSDDTGVKDYAVDFLERKGYHVSRLDGHSSVREFVVASVERQRATAVVWVLDSSFRSGFSLPFDVIVDSGVIATPGASQPFREISSAERFQTMNRIGRETAGDCFYHCRPSSSEDGFSLVGSEREFAAYLFRVFGFHPPASFSDARMTKVKLRPAFVRLKVWSGGTPVDQFCYKANGDLRPGVEPLLERPNSPEPQLPSAYEKLKPSRPVSPVPNHSSNTFVSSPSRRPFPRTVDREPLPLRHPESVSASIPLSRNSLQSERSFVGSCPSNAPALEAKVDALSDSLHALDKRLNLTEVLVQIEKLRAEVQLLKVEGDRNHKKQCDALLSVFDKLAKEKASHFRKLREELNPSFDRLRDDIRSLSEGTLQRLPLEFEKSLKTVRPEHLAELLPVSQALLRVLSSLSDDVSYLHQKARLKPVDSGQLLLGMKDEVFSRLSTIEAAVKSIQGFEYQHTVRTTY